MRTVFPGTLNDLMENEAFIFSMHNFSCSPPPNPFNLMTCLRAWNSSQTTLTNTHSNIILRGNSYYKLIFIVSNSIYTTYTVKKTFRRCSWFQMLLASLFHLSSIFIQSLFFCWTFQLNSFSSLKDLRWSETSHTIDC